MVCLGVAKMEGVTRAEKDASMAALVEVSPVKYATKSFLSTNEI